MGFPEKVMEVLSRPFSRVLPLVGVFTGGIMVLDSALDTARSPEILPADSIHQFLGGLAVATVGFFVIASTSSEEQ